MWWWSKPKARDICELAEVAGNLYTQWRIGDPLPVIEMTREEVNNLTEEFDAFSVPGRDYPTFCGLPLRIK